MDSVPRLRRPANADIGKPGDGLDGPEPRGAGATSDAPAAGVNDKSEDTPRPAPRNGWLSLARPRLLRWVAAIVLLVAFFASDAALWVLNPELVTYVRQQVGSQLGLAASEPAPSSQTRLVSPVPVVT